MRNRLLVLGAALIAFGASLGSGFHFDDYAIFSDRLLASAGGLKGVWAVSQTHPLTWFTLWLNYMAGGRDPLGYHLVNLALHLGAALLAYECLRRLLPERAALAAAAIFAVHPVQAEAVNYVSARSIVLAAVFCFGALILWLDGRRWLAVPLFALGLLASPECAALPLILLFLPREGKRDASAAAWFPLGAMVVLAFAAGARVVYAAGVFGSAFEGFSGGITPWKYFLAQGLAILRYLRLLIVPYGFTVDPGLSVPAVWLGLLAWAGVVALAVCAWRFRRTGWTLWFLAGLVLLLPASSVFPADLAADRRMYLPMLCFAAAAGLLLSKVNTPALAAGVAVALTMTSIVRTQVWMSEVSLWREAVSRAPQKARPKIQLSRVVRAREALELLSAAREIAPYDAEIPAEIGKIMLDERQPDAALDEFGRAIALDPKNAQHYNNRGVAFELLGLSEAARADFLHALEVDPGLTEARENLRKLPPTQ